LGLAEDLLQQAHHLATYEGVNPTQAALRRAVSTAYYALFHLLIEDASQRWNGSAAAATGLERAFNHGQMKNSSLQFDTALWRDWHGTLRTVPPGLQRVAQSFIDLQQERHIADYNNHEQWTGTDVEATIDIARAAFQDWQAVRTDPMAGDYLLSMLLGRPRQ
jgi:hypothetical protein